MGFNSGFKGLIPSQFSYTNQTTPHVCMYVCMYGVCMYIYVYVYIYIYIYI